MQGTRCTMPVLVVQPATPIALPLPRQSSEWSQDGTVSNVLVREGLERGSMFSANSRVRCGSRQFDPDKPASLPAPVLCSRKILSVLSKLANAIAGDRTPQARSLTRNCRKTEFAALSWSRAFILRERQH